MINSNASEPSRANPSITPAFDSTDAECRAPSAAKALGLDVPALLQQRADEVAE